MGDYMNKMGTFDKCSNCINKSKNCCTDFDNIDNPLITESELKNIKKILI